MTRTGGLQRTDFQPLMNQTRLFSLISILLVIFSLGLVAAGWVLPALLLLGAIVVMGVAIAVMNSRL